MAVLPEGPDRPEVRMAEEEDRRAESEALNPVEQTMAPGPSTTGIDPITGRPNLLPRSSLVYNEDSESGMDTSSESTISIGIRDDMEIIMWNSLTSPNTSPLVLAQLHQAGIILQTNDGPRDSSTVVLRDHLITMALTPPIPLDNFVPNLATSDTNNYLWFTWLSDAQYGEYILNGTVPGHKDTR
eukprot:4966192-Amphidinium_carterae.1